MFKNKIKSIFKYFTKTFSVFIVALLLLLFFTFLSVNTEMFIFDVILHSYFNLLFALFVVRIFSNAVPDLLTHSKNIAIVLCAIAIILDNVVVYGIRYFISNGISTFLFLPACLPICFMILAHYYFKDKCNNNMREKRWIYIIGIPLLILSVYFEVIAFM